MMLRFLVALVLVLPLASCKANPPPPPRKPSVEFQDGAILIEGKRAMLGAPVAQWIEVLGPNYRYANDRPSMLVWDDRGIAVYTDLPQRDRVRTVSFIFRGEPRESFAYTEPGEGVQPLHDFPGQVIIEGAIINADTQMDSIPRLSNRVLEIHCSRGIAICTTNRRDGKGITASYIFGFTVDDRHYQSLPYTAYFGLHP